MNPAQTGALVLAAGKGTRMHSQRPKVLHELLGEPMLWYLYKTLDPLFGSRVWTVTGHKAEDVRATFPERAAAPGQWIYQAEQLGTGHAVQSAWSVITAAGLEWLVVVNGDTPLLPPDKLAAFTDWTIASGADLSFMTLTLEEPGAFGRVLRTGGPEGSVAAIIEAKDYDPARHGPEPREINAGIYCLRVASIGPLLGRLENNNRSREYYLTDTIDMAVREGLKVEAMHCGNDPHLLGINSPRELIAAEETLRQAVIRDWQERGVLIRAADSVRIGPRVHLAPGVEIVGPCELYGKAELASETTVESHCWIKDARIGPCCRIKAFSHIEDAEMGPRCQVGPYGRLRPGARLMEDARVGNFVEVKKSVLGKGSKANHLTYLGDATVGDGVNIGAGTITCNYDGQRKHTTRIGDRAFIGSNTALVAPVDVGAGALVAAGSVITQDVPADMLSIARERQINIIRRDKA